MVPPVGSRIAIVSDAWHPQVNGVVRTLDAVVRELTALGYEVEVFGPDRFPTVPCPSYPEIRLALLPGRSLAGMLDRFAPHCLHLATEGPLGLAARAWGRRRNMPFTTSLHTRFPDYVQARTGLPAAAGWAMLRHFHAAAACTLVATASLERELAERGFRNLRLWSRGVDMSLFHPEPHGAGDLPRPVFLHVGRVAVEKNIPAFLELDLPGSKLVVGDGPLLPMLRRRFPQAHFTGAQRGERLARSYATSDVLVFPSRTDTFGLVMLESLACGTPVAAFPVPGPRDVLTHEVGVLSDDLRAAAMGALRLDRRACRVYAERSSWRACAETLLRHLATRSPGSELVRAGVSRHSGALRSMPSARLT